MDDQMKQAVPCICTATLSPPRSSGQPKPQDARVLKLLIEGKEGVSFNYATGNTAFTPGLEESPSLL